MVTFAAVSARTKRKLTLDSVPWSEGAEIDQVHDSECRSNIRTRVTMVTSELSSRMGQFHHRELKEVS